MLAVDIDKVTVVGFGLEGFWIVIFRRNGLDGMALRMLK